MKKVKCELKLELFITCECCVVVVFLLKTRCGDLQLSADTGGASGLLKKAVTGALSHETAVKPLYSGTGDVSTPLSYNQSNSKEAAVFCC